MVLVWKQGAEQGTGMVLMVPLHTAAGEGWQSPPKQVNASGHQRPCPQLEHRAHWGVIKATLKKLAPSYSPSLLSSCCLLSLKIVIPAGPWRSVGCRAHAHQSTPCTAATEGTHYHEHETLTNYPQRAGWGEKTT